MVTAAWGRDVLVCILLVTGLGLLAGVGGFCGMMLCWVCCCFDSVRYLLVGLLLDLIVCDLGLLELCGRLLF